MRTIEVSNPDYNAVNVAVERITAEIMSINAELAGMDGRRRELMDRCESLIAVQKNLSALLLKMQGL